MTGNKWLIHVSDRANVPSVKELMSLDRHATLVILAKALDRAFLSVNVVALVSKMHITLYQQLHIIHLGIRKDKISNQAKSRMKLIQH